jgi:hypothetical protein
MLNLYSATLLITALHYTNGISSKKSCVSYFAALCPYSVSKMVTFASSDRISRMRWFTLRKARDLPKADCDMLERFGAATVAAIIYGGFSGPLNTEPQKSLYENSTMRKHASEWLTEEYDRAERRETFHCVSQAA